MSATPENCPFCGGRSEFKTGHFVGYVMCLKCTVMGPNLSEAEAVGAWNSRVDDSAYFRDVHAKISAILAHTAAPWPVEEGDEINVKRLKMLIHDYVHPSLRSSDESASTDQLLSRLRTAVSNRASSESSLVSEVTPATLSRGGRYNWRGQPERLVFMGVRHYPGDSRDWLQFAKVESPNVCWCEVLYSDLHNFEVTKP